MRTNHALNALALLVALALPSVAHAQRTFIGVPLSVHVESQDGRSIVEPEYVDYAVEIANRWLRQAGVCVYVDSREELGRRLPAAAAEQRYRSPIPVYADSLPVAIVRTGVGVGQTGEALRGHGRAGRRPLAVLSRDEGNLYTLAHEIGHALGIAHSANPQAIMHASTPFPPRRHAEAQLAPMHATERAIARASAAAMSARLGRGDAARCASPRPIPDPVDIRSGSPILHQATVAGYRGERFFGMPHGHGEKLYADGSRYVGELVLGEREGFGEQHYASGNGRAARYRGRWRAGRHHGYGVMHFSGGKVYAGLYRDGREHGFGVLDGGNGEHYEGEWRDGMLHGRGQFRFANGAFYVGELAHGELHGQGMLRWPNGNRYEGEFFRGRRHGSGTLTFHNGDRFEGQWVDGERHGYGTYRWAHSGRASRFHYLAGRRSS